MFNMFATAFSGDNDPESSSDQVPSSAASND